MSSRRIVGFLMVAAGVGLALIPWWVSQVGVDASHVLVHPLRASAAPLRRSPAKTDRKSAVPVSYSPDPTIGSTVAELSIPALHLTVPVVQGTTTALLLLAPGHYTGSVLPGESGTSVIAAHNATFFRHINQLRTGDHIVIRTTRGTFTFAVDNKRIVSDTAGLPNTNTPTLDLEACCPLDALYFTSDRYVVFAQLIQASHTTSSASTISNSSSPFQATIPASITTHFLLALSDNSLPMGTFTYRAPSTPAVWDFQQSNRPLEAETIAVSLWLAYKDASQSANQAAVRSLWPGIVRDAAGNGYGNV